jgi:hypothetical protein
MTKAERAMTPAQLVAEQARQQEAARSRSRRTAPKRAAGRAAKQAKKVTKRTADAAVYEEVRDRDHGMCTVTLPESDIGPCGGALQIDHQWGRGKEPTRVENCRLLCLEHHRRKTDSEPNRPTWLRDFMRHALTHEYWQEVGKADRLIDLESAQHPEHGVRLVVREGTP